MRGAYCIPCMAIVITLLLAIPISLVSQPADGDGFYIPFRHFTINEPAQNAIIAWNGTHERMHLSIDIESEGETEGFHIIPFPSKPEVNLGSSEIYHKLERMVDPYYGRMNYNFDGFSYESIKPMGYEFVEYKEIGSHEVTVIKVTDPMTFKIEIFDLLTEIGCSIMDWPDGFGNIVDHYSNKGWDHYVIDRYSITDQRSTVEPLIFDFEYHKGVFPLRISSLFNSSSMINVAFLTPTGLSIDTDSMEYLRIRNSVILSEDQIQDLDPGMIDILGYGSNCILASNNVFLPTVKEDVEIELNRNFIWTSSLFGFRNLKNIELSNGSDALIGWGRGVFEFGNYSIARFDPHTSKPIWKYREPEGFENRDHLSIRTSNDCNIPADHVLLPLFGMNKSALALIDLQTGAEIWFNENLGNTGSNYFGELVQFNETSGRTIHLFGNDLIDIATGEVVSTFPEEINRMENNIKQIRPVRLNDRLLLLITKEIVSGRYTTHEVSYFDPWIEGEGELILNFRINPVDTIDIVVAGGNEKLITHKPGEYSSKTRILDPYTGNQETYWNSSERYGSFISLGDLDRDCTDEILVYGEIDPPKIVDPMTGKMKFQTTNNDFLSEITHLKILTIEDMDNDGFDEAVVSFNVGRYPSHHFLIDANDETIDYFRGTILEMKDVDRDRDIDIIYRYSDIGYIHDSKKGSTIRFSDDLRRMEGYQQMLEYPDTSGLLSFKDMDLDGYTDIIYQSYYNNNIFWLGRRNNEILGPGQDPSGRYVTGGFGDLIGIDNDLILSGVIGNRYLRSLREFVELTPSEDTINQGKYTSLSISGTVLENANLTIEATDPNWTVGPIRNLGDGSKIASITPSMDHFGESRFILKVEKEDGLVFTDHCDVRVIRTLSEHELHPPTVDAWVEAQSRPLEPLYIKIRTGDPTRSGSQYFHLTAPEDPDAIISRESVKNGLWTFKAEMTRSTTGSFIATLIENGITTWADVIPYYPIPPTDFENIGLKVLNIPTDRGEIRIQGIITGLDSIENVNLEYTFDQNILTLKNVAKINEKVWDLTFDCENGTDHAKIEFMIKYYSNGIFKRTIMLELNPDESDTSQPIEGIFNVTLSSPKIELHIGRTETGMIWTDIDGDLIVAEDPRIVDAPAGWYVWIGEVHRSSGCYDIVISNIDGVDGIIEIIAESPEGESITRYIEVYSLGEVDHIKENDQTPLILGSMIILLSVMIVSGMVLKRKYI